MSSAQPVTFGTLRSDSSLFRGTVSRSAVQTRVSAGSVAHCVSRQHGGESGWSTCRSSGGVHDPSRDSVQSGGGGCEVGSAPTRGSKSHQCSRPGRSSGGTGIDSELNVELSPDDGVWRSASSTGLRSPLERGKGHRNAIVCSIGATGDLCLGVCTELLFEHGNAPGKELPRFRHPRLLADRSEGVPPPHV